VASSLQRKGRMEAQAKMVVRKTSNKIHNKKLRRRREGLSTKSYEYGELEGVELALFVHYPKSGDFYSYLSKQQLPWLGDLENMVGYQSHIFHKRF
jgi:type II secretory pathway component HofQ